MKSGSAGRSKAFSRKRERVDGYRDGEACLLGVLWKEEDTEIESTGGKYKKRCMKKDIGKRDLW